MSTVALSNRREESDELPDTFMASDSLNNNKPSSISHKNNSSSGATSVIRKKLHFDDEAMWKKFSSRRLQLVESLSLSSKKASEQDHEINICARTLMVEFSFPDGTLPEFDKLVRLAIQSVRRNKKRSEKRMANKVTDSTNDNSSMPCSRMNPSSNEDDILMPDLKRQKIDHSSDNLKFLSEIMIEEDESNRRFGYNNNNDNNNDTNSNNNNNSTTSIHGNGNYLNQNDKDQVAKLAIGSLVTPVLPNNHRDRDRDLVPVNNSPLNINEEFIEAAQSILSCIKKSKTCFDSTSSVNTTVGFTGFDTLEELGSNCISSSVLMALERWYDHLSPDSTSYIKLRLKGDLTLSAIVKNLETKSVEVTRLSDYVAAQLFKKLVGACVKDFGFNAVLYPLCDIFHTIVDKDYPLLTREAKAKSNSKLSSMSPSPQPSSRGDYFNANTEIGIIDSTISKPVLSTTSPLPVLPPSSGHQLLHITSSSNNTPAPPNLRSPMSGLIGTSGPFSLLRSTSASSTSLPPPPPPPPLLHSLHSSSLVSSSNSDNLITVIIKYNEKELKFIYSANTNSPPTILELISNSKTAFGIITNNRVLRIRNQITAIPINNDFEIERLFQMHNGAGGGVIRLELVYYNVIQDFLNLNYDSPQQQHRQTAIINGTSTTTSSAFNPGISTSVISNGVSGNSTGSTVSTNANSPFHNPNINPIDTPGTNNGKVLLPPISHVHQTPDNNDNDPRIRSRLPFMKFQPLL